MGSREATSVWSHGEEVSSGAKARHAAEVLKYLRDRMGVCFEAVAVHEALGGCPTLVPKQFRPTFTDLFDKDLIVKANRLPSRYTKKRVIFWAANENPPDLEVVARRKAKRNLKKKYDLAVYALTQVNHPIARGCLIELGVLDAEGNKI